MSTRLLTIALMVCAAASAGAQKQGAGQEVPDAYKPPKGMCRVWLKDVPPAQQPAPTDCATAVKNTPPNGRVIFGDTEESRNKPKADPKDPVPTKGYTPKPGEKKPPVIPRKPPQSGR